MKEPSLLPGVGSMQAPHLSIECVYETEQAVAF